MPEQDGYIDAGRFVQLSPELPEQISTRAEPKLASVTPVGKRDTMAVADLAAGPAAGSGAQENPDYCCACSRLVRSPAADTVHQSGVRISAPLETPGHEFGDPDDA